MHAEVVQPHGLLQYLIPIAVFAVIFAFRVRRMSQMRPLKLEQLWIVPAIYVLLVAGTFVATPPTATGWLVAVIALAAGAALGWQRGRLMTIHVDPETHALNQKGSPLAILLLLGIVVVKVAAQEEGRSVGLDVALITDAALAFALGLFGATRVEMYLRGKRLLAEARAGRAVQSNEAPRSSSG